MASPIIFDRSDGQDLRINMIGSWLKKRFHQKIVKLSIDGGFTCPNRDGSKGTGGCLFCSDLGSGDMAAGSGRIAADLDTQIRLLEDKWPDAGYLAYFQSHTNTYGPAAELREKYLAALSHERVRGIVIATRPDCLDGNVLDLLEELSRRTFLWVELGLQSIHRETMERMNLCYTLEDYDRAAEQLRRRGIRQVTHLILGLPGETPDMMLEGVRYVCRSSGSTEGGSPGAVHGEPGPPRDTPSEGGAPFGLKLHMLNVVSNSRFPEVYPDYCPFGSIEEYTDLVIRLLEHVPPQVTIHRISGDAPRPVLIAPEWSWKKRTILNGIHARMRERNTWQGRLAE